MPAKIRWTTQMVADEMKKEDCILLNEYVTTKSKLRYLYNNKEYTVRWRDWYYDKNRPHKNICKQKTKWTTEKVRELFANEGCILKSEYVNCKTRLVYEYNGNEFTTTLDLWKTDKSRPHLHGGNFVVHQWTNEEVHKLFEDENCELLDNYVNKETKMKYKFNGSTYTTSLSNWLDKKNPNLPHYAGSVYEHQFRRYLDKNNIKFETQYMFDDLRSKNYVKLRFDFYIPDMNLLIEVDGDENHFYKKTHIERDTLKNNYCTEHKIKLLRIDCTVNTDDEYEKALNQMKNLDDGVFIIKFGELYKRQK